MGAYDEVVARGAFTQTLGPPPGRQLLTTTKACPWPALRSRQDSPGTFSSARTTRGLHVVAQLDRSDPDAQPLVKKIRAGLLDQMSFAFKVTKQQWSDDRALRTIQAVDINRGDVSVVNQGANRCHPRRRPQSRRRSAENAVRIRRLKTIRIRNEAGRTLALGTAQAIADAARLRGLRGRR